MEEAETSPGIISNSARNTVPVSFFMLIPSLRKYYLFSLILTSRMVSVNLSLGTFLTCCLDHVHTRCRDDLLTGECRLNILGNGEILHFVDERKSSCETNTLFYDSEFPTGTATAGRFPQFDDIIGEGIDLRRSPLIEDEPHCFHQQSSAESGYRSVHRPCPNMPFHEWYNVPVSLSSSAELLAAEKLPEPYRAFPYRQRGDSSWTIVFLTWTVS